MIRFTIPAVPVAQPRGRAAVSKSGKPYVMSAPRQSPIHAFKAACQVAASTAHAGAPLSGPLRMVLVFVMPRAKKTKVLGRSAYAPKGRNDWDNLGKGVCDALNKRLFEDDGLLAEVTVRKFVAAADEQPHVEVTIEALENAT